MPEPQDQTLPETELELPDPLQQVENSIIFYNQQVADLERQWATMSPVLQEIDSVKSNGIQDQLRGARANLQFAQNSHKRLSDALARKRAEAETLIPNIKPDSKNLEQSYLTMAKIARLQDRYAKGEPLSGITSDYEAAISEWGEQGGGTAAGGMTAAEAANLGLRGAELEQRRIESERTAGLTKRGQDVTQRGQEEDAFRSALQSLLDAQQYTTFPGQEFAAGFGPGGPVDIFNQISGAQSGFQYPIGGQVSPFEEAARQVQRFPPVP